MGPFEALTRAARFYESRLAAVASDEWLRPSVCEGWTVRDVADHVLGGNRFAVGLLGGLSAPVAYAAAVAPGFADDPLDAYRSSVTAQQRAFRAPGALTRTLAHPAGDISGSTFLGFRVGDLLLHGWDLARSVGGDDQLDCELVPIVWAVFQPVLETANQREAFGAGASGAVGVDAPLSERLLDLTGRLR